MLPMVLAPAGETVVARAFEPLSPTGDNLDMWPDAAAWAERYWREVQANEQLEADMRAFAGNALTALAAIDPRVAPGRSRSAQGTR